SRHSRVAALRVVLEEVQDPSEELTRRPVVPEPTVNHGQIRRCRDLKVSIAQSLGHRDVPLAQLPRLLQLAEPSEALAYVARGRHQALLVTQGLRERLGAAEVIEQAGVLAERRKGTSELEPDVDRPLCALPRIGQALEGLERLLEVRDGLPVGR